MSKNLLKRYNVFISSPFDPNWVRNIAFRSVLISGHVTYLFDQQAEIGPALDSIRSALDDSQMYILLLSHRLGSRPRPESKTYTELEFDRAYSHPNMRIAVFYQDKEEVKLWRNKLDTTSDEGKNNKDYWTFYEYLTKDPALGSNPNFTRIPWSEKATDEFAARLTHTTTKFAEELNDVTPPIGWVRATDKNTQEEIVKSLENELRVEVVKKFNQFVKLDERCKIAKEAKREIGKMILDVFTPTILKEKYDIFLDSGSTISYVAQAIGQTLKASIQVDAEGKPDIEVFTNNVLAYLHLWLKNGVPCTMFPPGEAEEPYGASYGPISNFGHGPARKDRGPQYRRKDLSLDDKERLEKVKQMFGRHHKPSKLITIGTISGIKLSEKVDLEWGEGGEDIETKEAIENCFGFHTGNYFHMLSKRFFYDNDYPAVVCIHEEKLDGPVKVGQCHFVFDATWEWSKFVREKPLAFCIGYEKRNKSKVKAIIEEKLQFKIIEPWETMGTHQALLAANDRFKNKVNLDVY